MLTIEDIPFPVTKDTIGGVECWRYLGNELFECIRFARFIQSHGERFYDPLTEQIAYVHRAILDKPMLLLLAAMEHYHKYQEYTKMLYPTDFPVVSPKAARGFTTNYNYLVHFGFLTKEYIDGDVYYWVTDFGRKFIQGVTDAYTELNNIGPRVLNYIEGTKRSFASYFEPSELVLMRKPLWFLPEKYRQEILTDDELAQE